MNCFVRCCLVRRKNFKTSKQKVKINFAERVAYSNIPFHTRWRKFGTSKQFQRFEEFSTLLYCLLACCLLLLQNYSARHFLTRANLYIKFEVFNNHQSIKCSGWWTNCLKKRRFTLYWRKARKCYELLPKATQNDNGNWPDLKLAANNT